MIEMNANEPPGQVQRRVAVPFIQQAPKTIGSFPSHQHSR